MKRRTMRQIRLWAFWLTATLVLALGGRVEATNYTFDVSQDVWSGTNQVTLTSSGLGVTSLVNYDTVEFYSSTADLHYYDCGNTARQIKLDTKTGIVLRQRPGYPQVIITGAVRVTGTWTVNPGSVADLFRITVAGIDIAGGAVTYRYSSTTSTTYKASGSHGGYLSKPAYASVGATANSANVSGTTLDVNVQGLGATPPADGEIEWVRGQAAGHYQGISLTSCTNCTVSGLRIERISVREANGADGYGCLGVDCTGCTFYALDLEDCADHCAGFLGGTNNSLVNCVGDGTGPHQPDSIFVFYAKTGNIQSGARVTGCTAYVRGLYTRSFTPLPADNGSSFTNTMAGFWAHAQSYSATCYNGDIEYRQCTAVVDQQFFGGVAGASWASMAACFKVADTGPVLGDPWSAASYPVRFIECVKLYGQGENWSSNYNEAYVRCRFQETGCAAAGNDLYRYNTGSYGAFGWGGGSSNSAILFQACDIYSTLHSTVTNPAHVQFGFGSLAASANLRYRIDRCSLRDGNAAWNAGGSVCAMFSNPNDNPANSSASGLEVRNTLIAFVGTDAGTKARVHGSAQTFASVANWQAMLKFTGNWYYGYDATVGYSTSPAALATATGWSTGSSFGLAIDAQGTYGTNPLFVSATGATAALQATSPVLTTTKYSSNPSVKGINGVGGQNAGCYQNGQVPRSPL